MSGVVRVGLVGCGAISGAYLAAAPTFPVMKIVACADLMPGAAEHKANEFGVPRVCSVDELLAADDIDVVLNLTVPKAHAAVALRALEAGKHTYCEKPLGIAREEGRQVLDVAARRALRVGCAPDTFLGAGVQTARKLIDDGAIGRPVAFTAFCMSRGHETWHPSPEFYYERGGGPMFDMGPYYLTALFTLLGPLRRLSGAATVAVPRRTVTSQPKAGKTIEVETPDHVCGTMEFENGAAGVMIQTFATHHPQYDADHPITIYGTDGTLKVPDPNTFDGSVQLRRGDDAAWRDVPHAFLKGYGRSVGLADMCHAIRSGRPHRASGELGFAVLDAMQGFLGSSETGAAYHPAAAFERPAPMPAHLPFGVLDE
jgi:predicted dehydrogenase